jgi:hypothetical protein
MSTKQTNFQFSLSGVVGDPIDFRCRQNVKKRIASIRYLENPPQDAVRLQYVGSKEISPAVDLHVGDRSDSLYTNSRFLISQEFELKSGDRIDSQNFVVTQIYISAESGNLPLYYRHILPALVVPQSIKVYDQNYVEVNAQRYKVEPQEDRDDDGDLIGYTAYNLFNSLESSYNHDTGEYVVYFVQYTDRTTGSDIVVTELLSNRLAYEPAISEDFWSVTPGELKPWKKVYYQDPLTGEILFPPDLTGAKSYIKYIERQRLGVVRPIEYRDSGPWFVRVSNGFISSSFQSFPLEYSVPEFDNQAFNPIAPYKLAARAPAIKIADRIVKLAHEEIESGSMFSYLYLVLELDGAAKYALTDDPSYEGMSYTDFDGKSVQDTDGSLVTWTSDGLLSIDRRTGFVHLGFDITDSYNIYGIYTYIERHYTVNGLTMNPVIDKLAQRQTRVIYLIPQCITNGNLTTFDVGIHWLKVSASGLIEQASASGLETFGSNVTLSNLSGFDIEGFVGLHYSWSASTTAVAQSPLTTVVVTPGGSLYVASTEGFPRSGWLRAVCLDGTRRYFKYTDKTDTTFIIDTIQCSSACPNIANGGTVELVNWVDEYTVTSTHTASSEITYYGGATSTYPGLYRQYFVLAELSINPPHKIEDLTIIDVRENGGGVDKDKYEEAKLLNPEIQWYNDYLGFNGQVYPSNAVSVVKLPISLKDTFSLDAIRNIVKESVPMGIYPLIRFYGYEPRIRQVIPGAYIRSIQIDWEKEGSEFTYDIWYSYNENGPWVKANGYRLVDGSGTYNTFTITDLSENMACYVKLTMEDKYYQWWYGYSSYDSIEGGLGLEEDTPTPPFGNTTNFQFEIL